MRRSLTIEESDVAKLFATETLDKTLDEMVHLHGGGYMLKYWSRSFVDKRASASMGGASEVMHELISGKR
ncbi:hypothetical protein AWV79_34030 [Cupriavidus sp. UYMMa02A]|nr:hypothetical protein AWV79_34030 [Cupriavidus sp. UYMMa02A]